MLPLLMADTKAGLLLGAAFGEAECGLVDVALAVRPDLGDAAAGFGTAAFGEAAATAVGDTAAGLGNVNAGLEGVTAAFEDREAALGGTAAACKLLL